MPPRPIPEGYHSVTPYLVVTGAASAIEFYKHAFGAKEVMRIPHPDGRVGHAELQMGDSRIMLADEFPEMGARSPMSLGGTPVSILLYVDDVDADARTNLGGSRGVVCRYVGRDDGTDDAAIFGADVVALPSGRGWDG